MASSSKPPPKDKAFLWTDELQRKFLDLLVAYQRKYVRDQQFSWVDLAAEFEEATDKKCGKETLKNKHNTMKERWREWKDLKHGETNLGWDPASGTIAATKEWWDKKNTGLLRSRWVHGVIPKDKVASFVEEPANNAKEAFNSKHSSLRGAIERSFGIYKGVWKITRTMPKYEVQKQVEIILACFTLHNFIRRSSDDDEVDMSPPDDVEVDDEDDAYGDADDGEESFGDDDEDDEEELTLQDDIARRIWADRRGRR